MAFKDRAVD